MIFCMLLQIFVLKLELGLKGAVMFKFGYCAVVGVPNAGKSSLLNAVVGEKVSIVTHKSQTTRSSIRGVYNCADSQIVFVDTPGFRTPKGNIDNLIVGQITQSLDYSDVIVFVIKADERFGRDFHKLSEICFATNIPVIAVISKIDTVSKLELIPIISKLDKMYKWGDVVPVSSLKMTNMDTFIDVLKGYIPEGRAYFEGDVISLESEKITVSEYVREEILMNLHDEIPYDIMVQTERCVEASNRIDILCSVIVKRFSQKGIVIGKNGSMLKRIGSKARVKLEEMFKKHVRIELFVKVVENWD